MSHDVEIQLMEVISLLGDIVLEIQHRERMDDLRHDFMMRQLESIENAIDLK